MLVTQYTNKQKTYNNKSIYHRIADEPLSNIRYPLYIDNEREMSCYNFFNCLNIEKIVILQVCEYCRYIIFILNEI